MFRVGTSYWVILIWLKVDLFGFSSDGSWSHSAATKVVDNTNVTKLWSWTLLLTTCSPVFNTFVYYLP